jgi:hypothetical protein
MEPLGVVALVFGTLLIIGGMGVVVWRELATHPERRLVGRFRDVIEVLLPVVGIVILVVITWAVVVR